MADVETPDAGCATMDSDLDYARLRGTIDGAMTPMMMVDRDLNIIFANNASVDLLKKNEATLRSLYPGFRIEDAIGTNIDIFHARPEHQRRLLGDPRNLPFGTIIEVGPLRFKINVTAALDEAGEFVGCNLEWSDETERLASEDKVRRLESAVEGATTALMLCDEDFQISYMNAAVKDVLRPHQAALASLFPGFDVERLIGVCIDRFHQNPAKQRAMLRDPSRLPYDTQIEVLGLTFDLTATGVFDEAGNVIGNAIEWRDVSAQKRAETLIAELIGSASAGALEERLDTNEFAGFLKVMAESINGLLDAVIAPVQETIRVAGHLAEGNLNEQMSGEYAGGFAQLRDALNLSVENLRTTISQISQSSSVVSESARDIATGNSELQTRTEDQAQSLQETASSIEEMTATISQNADNSTEADKLATTARTTAEKGGEVVSRAVASMAEINSSSKKISDIIGVIDEIAFQTNLLALNAAVEAARAGEQGRGFAVVATEVRNLAQRSAEAAKEIKSLISESVDKVEQGTKYVDESGETLEEIVQSVKKVSDIVGEIAAASQEQAAGVEQINKAITNIDEVTQQNAAQVEEATAAAESLNDQARSLGRLVSNFDIGEMAESDDRAPAPQRRRRPSKPAPKRDSGGSSGSSAPSRPRPSKDDDQEWEDF